MCVVGENIETRMAPLNVDMAGSFVRPSPCLTGRWCVVKVRGMSWIPYEALTKPYGIEGWHAPSPLLRVFMNEGGNKDFDKPENETI